MSTAHYSPLPTGDDICGVIVCTVCNAFAVPNNLFGQVGITEHVKREHPMLFAALKAGQWAAAPAEGES